MGSDISDINRYHIDIIYSIWVNYNDSPTWIKSIWGWFFPKINHDFQGSGEQWGRDEIYPDISTPWSRGSRVHAGDFNNQPWWGWLGWQTLEWQPKTTFLGQKVMPLDLTCLNWLKKCGFFNHGSVKTEFPINLGHLSDLATTSIWWFTPHFFC